jgi:flagellar hook-length control protein FliK
VIETRTPSELTTKKAETIEKTVSEAKGKEAISQSDTEYDFVSMLRQLSSQSAKNQAQTTVKPMPETNMPVPKEQGLNLVQEMVTSLVENKEGQKTYQTTLHLTPETLGKVTVELSFNEEGLSGKLTFQSDEARRWMEGEWLDLKLPLESKGLNIKSFDFTTSQPAAQQQSGFSFSEQSEGSGQDTERRSASGQDSSAHSENDEQNEEMNKNKPNGLNVYV